MDNTFNLEYSGQTTLHPVGMGVGILCAALIMTVPRRYSLWPMIVVACFIAPAQRVVVAGLNFDMLRIMVVFACLRIFMRREGGIKFGPLDKAMVVWAIVMVVVPTLNLGFGVLANKTGYAFDAVGIYFVCRCLIRDWDDLRNVIFCFTIVAVPVALAFMVEKSTGHNGFAFLGGVPEITEIRNGRLRCQGAFAHPILAGCFWAVLIPFVCAMRWNGWSEAKVLFSLCTMTTIIILSASSTPLMGIIFTAIGAVAFKYRYRMREIRWWILGSLIVIHFIREKPVWHLLARVDVLSGSTGWHRYHLIDEAINHASEWFLIGTTTDTRHWGYGLEDVTNFYVVQGLHGGILQLTTFMAIIVVGFGAVGRTWRAAGSDQGRVILAWAMGVSLFIHVMNLLAVSYFGQIYLVWYMSLAVIGSMSALPATAATVARPPVRQMAGPYWRRVRGVR